MSVTEVIQATNRFAAIKGYAHTDALKGKNPMPVEDKQLALAGFPYTCPDELPLGFNSISATNNPTDDNNGLLNVHGHYNEDGLAPVRTFLAVG